jgi:hypothetical protein
MAGDTAWGIHAGKTGDAATLFLKKNVVALPLGRRDPSSRVVDSSTYRPGSGDGLGSWRRLQWKV